MAAFTEIELAEMQKDMTDQQKLQFSSQYNSSKKDPTIAIILAVVLGTLGVDRFYVGDIGLGVLKLLTGGVCGIMWLIDIFLISGRAHDVNREKAQEVAQAVKISS